RMAVLPGMNPQIMGPEVHVALALEPDEERARSVVMRLVVATHRPLGDVAGRKAGAHAIARKLPTRDLLLHVLDRLVEHVQNEVCMPEAEVVPTGGRTLVRTREVVLAAVIDLLEIVVAVENELERTGRRALTRLSGPAREHPVHELWRGRHTKIEHRLLAQVVHAVVGVLGWREEAALPPFEGALRPVLLPDLRGAGTLQDQRELLVEMMLYVQRLPRGDLADEHAALRLVGPCQLQERSEPLARARPRGTRN